MLATLMLLAALPATAADLRLLRVDPIHIDLATPRRDASPSWELQEPDPSLFYRGVFLPGVYRQLRKQGPMPLIGFPGQSLADNILFEDVTRATRNSMQRAATDAVKDFLLAETTLGALVDRFDRNSVSVETRAGRGRALKFRPGLSHGLPELTVGYGTFNGDLRVTVDARAEVGVSYRASGASRTLLRARFDPREDYFRLDCRFAF